MTILIAGGDSFTYGSELANDHMGPSCEAWPAVLSDTNGWDCINVAKGGMSNAGISRTVIDAVMDHSDQLDDLVVGVMWTFPHRPELLVNSEFESFTLWDSFDSIASQLPKHARTQLTIDNHAARIKELDEKGIRDYIKAYYKIESNELAIYNSLKEVLLLQYFLESKKVKYFFTCCDDSIFSLFTDTILTPIANLYMQLDMYNWITFDGEGFNQWAKENNYEYATTHPMAAAHIDAALYIGTTLNEKGISTD